MLHRYEVDWEANSFDEEALGELSEFLLRVLYSFLIDTARARVTTGSPCLPATVVGRR